MLDKQLQQKSAHDYASHTREWKAGDKVMVRNLRRGPTWVPGIVAEVLGPITYLVDTDEGQRWKRHADQIKSWISPIRLQT